MDRPKMYVTLEIYADSPEYKVLRSNGSLLLHHHEVRVIGRDLDNTDWSNYLLPW